MHNAPSVSYPVGRCAFQRQLYLFLLLATLAVLGAWALNQGITSVWWGFRGFVITLHRHANLERSTLVFA